MTRSVWNAALNPNVLGISTDMVLFNEHRAQLVHHYRVYGDCVSHGSLRGTFMAELLDFTNRACAEARSVAKRGRDSNAESSWSPGRPALSPTSPMNRTPDDDPPARKAARAVTSAMQDESSPVGISAAVSIAQYSALPAPVVCPFPSGRR